MATADKLVNLADLKTAYDTTVRHDAAQTLTATQQRTARDNIGATDETIFEAITGNTPLIGNDGSASNRNCAFSRVGQRYTVSRTAAHSSNSDFSLMPNMHGANYSSAGNNFTTWCAESTMALKPGARYRLELKLVSGTPVSGSTGFSIRVYNESATQLTSNTLTVTTRRAVEFTFTGTYFAVMCFVSSGFYTGTDNALVFDLVLTELDSEEEVTGTDPTIMARPDCAYICGTVNTLSFTPCGTGLCSVRFTSGTTPTVLTLPNTVKMPDWWTGVEASRTYEISIADGVYGVVTSWST